MIKKSIITATIILCLISNLAKAQETDSTKFEAEIKVISKVVKDTISLRWGPSNHIAWELCNHHGYIVKRYTTMRDGKLLKNVESKILTNTPLKPLPLEKWEEKIEEDDRYAAITAQSVYGQDFDVQGNTGDLMQMINQAKEAENRFSFAMFCADQSFEVAQMSGLAYIDTDVKENEGYLYKIYTLVPHEHMPIDTGYIFIKAKEHTNYRATNDLSVESMGKAAFLSWNTFLDYSLYTNYIVERSDDNGKSFKKVNRDMFINPSPEEGKDKYKAYYVDSIPEYNKKYYYRIRGKSPFGNLGMPSDTVEVVALEKLPVVPFISSYNIIDNKGVRLEWQYKEEYNPKILGFKIVKSRKEDGKYKKADLDLTKHQKSKTLTNKYIAPDLREAYIPKVDNINYIKVIAVDKNGFEYESFPVFVQLEDNMPPMSPQQIEGLIDTTGTVTIKWEKNTEEDLKGYRVFSANSKNVEFIQITKDVVRDTVFTTKTELKTLSKKIYYKIIAEDFHGNPSKFSDILELERPDILPPAPAFIVAITQTDSCINIKWKNSASKDVEKLKIQRKNMADNSVETLATLTKEEKDTLYSDYAAKIGIKYEYNIIVEDAAGNKTKSPQSVKGQRIDRGIRGEIEDIRITADRLKKQIDISWECNKENIYRFYIYRAHKEYRLRMYKTIPGDQFTFTDSNLQLNTKYTYRIKAEYENGKVSPMSEPIFIKY